MTRPGTMGGTFKHGDHAHVFDQGRIVNCIVAFTTTHEDGSVTVVLDGSYGIRYSLDASQVGQGWLMVGGD